MRMPDQRTRAGRRDHAILLVLGETGIRNFELRALTGADLLRRRRDSPTRSIRVHGKGGRGRLLTLRRHADQAVEE
jgi:site-specific recombinase XerD